jgi:hypothetical protein
MKALNPQMIDQREKIVRTGTGLRPRWIYCRTSVSSPIVRDDAVAGRGESRKLVFPHLAAARCGVYQDDRHATAV